MKNGIFGLTIAAVVTFAMCAKEVNDRNSGLDGNGHRGVAEMQQKELDPAKIVERRVERLTSQLDLTQAQQAQVKDILTEDVSRAQQLRQQHRQLQEATDKKLQSVFNEEQRGKFAQMRSFRGGPRGNFTPGSNRRGHHGGKGMGKGGSRIDSTASHFRGNSPVESEDDE